MRRILLTSAGLTDNFKKLFWEKVNKEPEQVKIIFVPSAATENDGAREGISLCIYMLMEMGIRMENILVYNLKYMLSQNYTRTYSRGVDNLPREFRLLTSDELKEYDVIVFSGGEAPLLVDEIKRTGFDGVLNPAVEDGLFYIGISAGSMVAAGNFKDGLGYIKNHITVHCECGSECGMVENDEDICLTDEQAVWIEGDSVQIIK